ncbi:hypothetical protein HQ520_15245 [bacterium]|nr:hypothetical protein [bacterium]
MRAIVETRHSLVIEAKGRRMLVVLPFLIVIHALAMASLIDRMFTYSQGLMAWVVIILSVLGYGALAALLAGPLADKITVTFEGQKYRLTIERKYPGNLKSAKTFSFRDIEQFEVSPPEEFGFCQVRFSDGRLQRLFSIGKKDSFSPMQRLEEITKKKTVKA